MPNHEHHGSSQWATAQDLEQLGYVGSDTGIPLGYITDRKTGQTRAIRYNDDGHMLTVAKTRSGKGTTQIIPELLEHDGSIFCIDPKGENAIITATARRVLHDQEVHIVDPWGGVNKRLTAAGRDELPQARFNPLDMLSPDSPDLVDDAMMIADALIMADGGDSHWSNEAKAMVMGFIIHLVTSPKEEGRRTLGRLREILSLHPSDFQNLVSSDMAEEGHPLAQSAANRIMQKSEKELSSVISTAQQNTHFLESDMIKESLSQSDFSFDALTQNEGKVSVYLVIPPERLKTHGRWLRLLVSMALTAMARGTKKPDKPTLFLLDEFAALGKLDVVEQAYGLMAGYGMIIHAILQDFSQLQDLYGRRWQTFIANTSMLQCFGTRDLLTAEYISKLCGQTTIETISEHTHEIRTKGKSFFESADPNYTGMNDRLSGRPLIMPEEIIRMEAHHQILIMQHCNPIHVGRVPYFQNRYYYGTQTGLPCFMFHPDYETSHNLYDVWQDTEKTLGDTYEKFAHAAEYWEKAYGAPFEALTRTGEESQVPNWMKQSKKMKIPASLGELGKFIKK